MRQIGRLKNETSAKTFGDYLTCQDIRNSVEPDSDGTWIIWVLSEDQLDPAGKALADFQAHPSDPKFQKAVEKAGVIRQKEEKEKEEFARRVVTSDTMWGNFGLGPLTMLLIAACVAVPAFGHGFPQPGKLIDQPVYRYLYISLYPSAFAFLPEIHRGEYWRLITPAFIHMSLMHILFNMLWLKDLGSMIESRKGPLTLFLMVIIIAAGSNVAQYLDTGPAFGGMSGVIYGLFGYIWMRGRFDVTSGLRLHPTTVVLMIGWFFLCLLKLPIMPDVANMAHGVGLVMGMIWGAGPPLLKKLLKV